LRGPPRRPPLADPLFLSTAVEAVLRAGEIQRAGFGGDLHIEKKGPIDLVTEVDLAVERMFRALVAERFPDHQVVAEELGGNEPVRARHCWVFDPLDGTNNFAHGLPIFCSSLALEIDGRAEVAAVYDPTRAELFTAERGGGAHLNGVPLQVSSAQRLIDSMLVTGFSYNVHERQMRTYYDRASRRGGNTIDNMIRELESRLDAVVLRSGLARTIYAARQVVNHGHVTVNGKSVNIPSYQVKPGDVVQVKERMRQNLNVHESIQLQTGRPQPGWLELNAGEAKLTVNSLPSREQVEVPIQEQLIVELYSK